MNSPEAGIEMAADVDGPEILEFIYPRMMYIGSEEREEPREIEFLVECKCEWEPEQGLEIIVIDSHIVHVGGYTGDLEQYRR